MGKSIKNLSSVTIVGLDTPRMSFRCMASTPEGLWWSPRQVTKAVRRGQLLSFFASLPQCVVGIEGCSSAHHWARSLIELGHRVKLIPPAYVKPQDTLDKGRRPDMTELR